MASSPAGTLEQALDYPFRKPELMIEALTHRSHHHEYGDSFHNERLEFLGDAVIDLCVTEALMAMYPANDEGSLSKMRSQIVSESSLARVAGRLKLGSFVRLGRGEERSGGGARESLLADTFEALIAAVYLDGGLEAARRVLLANLEGLDTAPTGLEATTEQLLHRDFKSRLQELCQSVALGVPVYKCLESRGPDHQRRFVMALFLKDIELARSEAPTKKEATQLAAKSLLEKVGTSQALLDHLATFGSGSRRRRSTSRSPKEESPQ